MTFKINAANTCENVILIAMTVCITDKKRAENVRRQTLFGKFLAL